MMSDSVTGGQPIEHGGVPAPVRQYSEARRSKESTANLSRDDLPIPAQSFRNSATT